MKINKREKYLFSKTLVLTILYMILLIWVAALIVGEYSYYKKTSEFLSANAKDMVAQRINSLIFEINILPKGVGNDILFLKKLSSLNDIINLNSVNQNDLSDLKEDFLTFMDQNQFYYQLRYIDENGEEIIRVNNNEENIIIISENELQNKQLSEYFIETSRLTNDFIYISPLDLNVEDGIIENRGTKENPIYIPVLRYSTPVFNKLGERKGIVIANIYADYFLGDVRRFQREGELVVLINQDGYYLSHPNRTKEFGFMFEGKESFAKDYPGVLEEILFSEKKVIEIGDFIFSYRYIHPTTSTFGAYTSERKLSGNSEDSPYWMLISVSDKGTIETIVKNTKEDFYSGAFFSIIFAILVFIFIFLLAFKSNGRKK